ncbi:MAG: autotransporter domain-containing protein [Oceanicaulis sp.]
MKKTLKTAFLAAASAAVIAAGLSSAGHAIPYRDDVGDAGAQEFAAPWDGVIQIYAWDRASGNIFFNCTGSMINPRTVISAAHCFNSQPTGNWGFFSGSTTPIIAYGPDTFDALFNWIGTDDQFIDARNGLSFGLSVMLPDGADFANENFPAEDVAMIPVLDPLYTLPTYGMLFSPIPEDVFNAGVHVNMIGYGSYGPGSTGTVGINGRRRAGENMLGFLGSFNDFFSAVAQSDQSAPGKDNTQMTYWIDFDLPGRTGTCTRGPDSLFGLPDSIECSDWDGASGAFIDGDTVLLPGPSLDLFEGDALPNEVATAGGDSGGPLMAMNLGPNPLILGVLSGGFVDGFYSAAGQEYGSVSYYNPLFAYREWIAENNPYKYVSAAAGDGLWSDAARWSQDMDPGYTCYEGGELVQCTSIEPEQTVNPGTPSLGTVLGLGQPDLSGSAGEPASAAATNFAATGLAANIATGEGATNFAADGLVATVGGGVADDGRMTSGPVEAQAIEAGAAPAPTNNAAAGVLAANLGSGTTEIGRSAIDFTGANLAPATSGPGTIGGFTPNNDYANMAFFDVTLRNAGTTTFDVAFAEIDRLSIANVFAGLDIQAGNELLSLIGAEVFAGNLHVDGALSTREVVLWGGTLSGSGELNLIDFNLLFGNGQLVSGALFNVAGMVTPGDMGAIGDLTIDGDYIQSSAGAAVFDWDGAASDQLIVNGDVSLGGFAGINPIGGYVPTFGDTATVMQYTGALVGDFDGFIDLPGVLTLRSVLSSDSVQLVVDAANFSEIVEFTSPSQRGIADFLDNARDTSYGPLSSIYGQIDLLEGQNLLNALENLVPHEHYQLRRGASAHQTMFMRSMFDMAFAGGSSASAPVAPMAFTAQMMGSEQRMDLNRASLALATQQAAAGPQIQEVGQFRVFGEVGMVNGDVRTTAASGGGDLEGEFGFVGGDYALNEWLRLGASLGYADSTTDQALGGGGMARTDVQSIELAAYALATKGDLTGLLRVAGADHSADQTRSAVVGGVVLPVSGGQDGQTLEATIGASYALRFENGLQVSPYASLTWLETEFDASTSAGSPASLTLAESIDNELVARLGVNLAHSITLFNTVFEPRAYAGVANDRRTENNDVTFVSFNAAPGVVEVDPGVANDTWHEYGASVSTYIRDGFAVSLNFDAVDGQHGALDAESFSIGARFTF